ncbi:MAG TPA: hypothetical protein VIK21_08550 [Desulfuromonadaceae bacterium]
MNNSLRLVKYRIRFVFFACLFLALFSLNGCEDQKTGNELSTAGIAAGTTLGNYYDSLIQDTVDIWEMEAFSSSTREASFNEDQQKVLQSQIEALQHRARLARRLISVYNALKQLSSYDASGEVKGAAEKLAQEVQGIPVLHNSNVVPSSIIGSLSSDIAAWQQSKNIKKGSKLILDTLKKLKDLYDREIQAYKSIALERGNKVSNVVEYLLNKKLVLGLPLLQKVSESLGLLWATEKKPIEDEQTIKAIIEVAKVRSQRMAFLSSDAADSIANSLSLLIDNHQEFLKKKGLTLNEMLAAVQKAQSYIDEISMLRQESNKK